MPYATLESINCRTIFNRWRDSMADKPRTADYAVSTLKTVIDWAHDRVIIRADHVKPIKRLYRANRSDSIWTPAEIKAFHKHASPELGWAVDLAVATGLRQSDLIRLAWNHREGNSFQMRTSKRGKTVNIPITKEAGALLDRIEVRGPVILTTARTQTPWTADGLRASFRQVCIDAGIDRTFHDLRRTAATRLVSAGLSSGQVASIMGWSEDDVESMKRKYVSRSAVAEAALAMMENGG
jgi:integrase